MPELEADRASTTPDDLLLSMYSENVSTSCCPKDVKSGFITASNFKQIDN